MMGLDNPVHIAVLLLVVLLVFGARRLPEMGHSLGSGLRGFKDSLAGHAPTTEGTAASQGELMPAARDIASTESSAHPPVKAGQ